MLTKSTLLKTTALGITLGSLVLIASEMNRQELTGLNFLYGRSVVTTTPEGVLDQSHILEKSLASALRVSNAKNWSKSFMLKYLKDDGRIFFTGSFKDLDKMGTMFLSYASSVTINVTDRDQWPTKFLNKFLNNGGRLILSDKPSKLDAKWMAKNSDAIKLNITDVKAWNKKFLEAFFKRGGKAYYTGNPNDLQKKNQVSTLNWLLKNANAITILKVNPDEWALLDFSNNFQNNGGNLR